jgi:hypothetical protein
MVSATDIGRRIVRYLVAGISKDRAVSILYSEDGGNILRNVRNDIPDYMAEDTALRT